jgi:diguanylate cyclase (GGDEF)-like protein
MRAAIRDIPVTLPDRQVAISASLGCTAGFGGEVTAEMLIRTADTALYQAKRAGRDRVDFLQCIGANALAAV